MENNIESGSFEAKNEVLAFVWETVKIVVISLAIIIPIRYFLVQPFFVKGQSMEENFYNGDYLLVDEISYRLGEPRRGDVVIFRYPNDPSQFFIKRIAGLPGETVEVKNNSVKIYNKESPAGFVLNESFLTPGKDTSGNLRTTLDEDDYYVLGDNRPYSSDSRVWGALNKRFIVGRAFVRLWPLDAINIIHRFTRSPAK